MRTIRVFMEEDGRYTWGDPADAGPGIPGTTAEVRDGVFDALRAHAAQEELVQDYLRQLVNEADEAEAAARVAKPRLVAVDSTDKERL